MRTIVRALLCISLVPAAAVDAAAPSKEDRPTGYPSKPIRIILPLSAGGSADSIARTTADALAEGFGHPVVVDNRPGANGIIGMNLVSRATPDGYTLLIASGANLTVNPALHGTKPPDYAQVVERHAYRAPTQMWNAVRTGKAIFARQLRAVIAEYADSEEQIESELRDLHMICANLSQDSALIAYPAT